MVDYKKLMVHVMGLQDPQACPDCGFKLFDPQSGYKKEIGVEMHGVYDGVCYYMCPECNTAWNRFPANDRITEAVKGLKWKEIVDMKR
jgi:hypothetical protein